MDGVFSDISALSSMLGTAEIDAQKREEEAARAKTAALGPGDIGPKKQPANEAAAAPAAPGGLRKVGTVPLDVVGGKGKDIWAEPEAGEGGKRDEYVDSDEDDDDPADTRKRPHYDILMAQTVGAGDVYLGLSGVTPLTSDCHEMVVKISLPNTGSLKDLALDVKEQKLKLDSPLYKLRLGLPHKVKHKEGDAKWDSATKTLSVRLPVMRKAIWED